MLGNVVVMATVAGPRGLYSEGPPSQEAGDPLLPPKPASAPKHRPCLSASDGFPQQMHNILALAVGCIETFRPVQEDALAETGRPLGISLGLPKACNSSEAYDVPPP